MYVKLLDNHIKHRDSWFLYFLKDLLIPYVFPWWSETICLPYLTTFRFCLTSSGPINILGLGQFNCNNRGSTRKKMMHSLNSADSPDITMTVLFLDRSKVAEAIHTSAPRGVYKSSLLSCTQMFTLIFFPLNSNLEIWVTFGRFCLLMYTFA